jgi:hypothetical protein
MCPPATPCGRNGINIQDSDVAGIGVTAAQFLEALGAQQSAVDNIHVAATAAKLYRVRR